MNTKLTIFSMMLLALFSCKEAKENVDQTADYATGKTQIEKKIQVEQDINKLQNQNNKQLEEAIKDTP